MSASGFHMRLSEAARLIRARYTGPDVLLQGISTDSRKDVKDNLFIALHGPNFDAHEFVVSVHAAGAAACMVEHEVKVAGPMLIVDDTRRAMGRLAGAWRKQFSYPVIAVTGSNGKTTVKEMLAAILSQRTPVLATQGNLNNDIGVPLTLLRLDKSFSAAIIEMGANHPGEIDYLTGLAQPDVALITNAGPAHLEGFGSLEGVSRAKGEIYNGLGTDGVAVINIDDLFSDYWIGLNKKHQMLTFGLHKTADVSAKIGYAETGQQLELHTPKGKLDVKLNLIGMHNVMNALAASAAALAVNTPLEHIKAGLEMMHAVNGRMQSKEGLRHARIIDDTYNANPGSLQAALNVLSALPGARWLALGDMGELGEGSERIHSDAGMVIKAASVDRLYTLGELAARAAETYGPAARRFSSHEAMIDELRIELKEDVTLLVKGSRRSRMDKIVTALTLNGGRN